MDTNTHASISFPSSPTHTFTPAEQLLIRQYCNEYLTLHDLPPASLPASIFVHLSRLIPRHTPSSISQHWHHHLSLLPPIFPSLSPAPRILQHHHTLATLTHDLAIQQTQTTILSHSHRRLASRATKIARLTATNATLTAHLETLTSERRALAAETTRLKTALSSLQLAHARLQAQNERLRVDAGAYMHEESRVLGSRAEQAEGKVRELEGVVEGLRVEVENYSEEIRLLTEDDELYVEEMEEVWRGAE